MAHGLSCFMARRIGNRSCSPALAGGFFTTEPPGKPTVDSCCALISVKTSSLHYSSFSGSQNSLTYFAIRTLGSACFF